MREIFFRFNLEATNLSPKEGPSSNFKEYLLDNRTSPISDMLMTPPYKARTNSPVTNLRDLRRRLNWIGRPIESTTAECDTGTIHGWEYEKRLGSL